MNLVQNLGLATHSLLSYIYGLVHTWIYFGILLCNHRLSKCYVILINPLGNFCFVSQVLVKGKVVDVIGKV